METVEYGKNRQSTIARMRRHWLTSVRYATPKKVFNLGLVLFDYVLKRPKMIGRPAILKVEPTTRCNLACPGCIAHGTDFPLAIGDMSLETFQRIVDEAGPYLFKMSLYITGDPLINRNVYKMIKYASERNVGTVLSTNFHPFNKTRAAEMLDSGLSHLIIGLEGITQETYSAYRVGGKVDTVLKNIETLMEAKKESGKKLPFVEIQTVRLAGNEHELPEIERVAREFGVDRFTIREDFREYKPAQKDTRCFWLWFTALVDEVGQLVPCCPASWSTDERRTFGSIVDNSFDEIWNGPQYVQARKLFRPGGKRAELADSLCFGCDIFRSPETIEADRQLVQSETGKELLEMGEGPAQPLPFTPEEQAQRAAKAIGDAEEALRAAGA